MNMARGDSKQKKLTFERSRRAMVTDRSMAEGGDAAGVPEVAQPTDLGAVMAELRSGFWALDARFDTMLSRLDKMRDVMNKPDTRSQGVEDCISYLDSGANKVEKRL
ncbi:hypothetical protein NDU88_003386 [Pleurodeles waltl]|uniref:Uncharacterized protein n=1 Tax=Pleurodeles waltl TaxID=8319 RepID=A0AAV7SFE4_PLEWA|nr:hypothetical protein NDU88_003386 [Pleurodeles waltl]